jgi:hypothetical protein
MIQLAGNITTEGKLIVFNQPALTAWREKHRGLDIVLSVKVKRKHRSNPQNGYYWGVIVPMVMDAINSYGNEFDKDETHEFLKSKFNLVEVEVKDGGYLLVPRSTGELDTAEFSSYCEQIRQFSSMVLGVYIPAPNEQMTIDHYLNQE